MTQYQPRIFGAFLGIDVVLRGEGFARGVREQFNKVDEDLRKIHTGLGSTKTWLGDLEEFDKGVEGLLTNVNEELAKTNAGLKIVTDKTAKLEKKIRSLPSLYAYVKGIKRQLGLRAAKYRFTNNPTEKIKAYIVGPFKPDRFGINPTIEGQLEKAWLDIKKNSLQIDGVDAFASNSGKSEDNQTLSEGRAQAIANWFNGKGLKVPDDKVHGRGETTEFGIAMDNRCAIIFAALPSSSIP